MVGHGFKEAYAGPVQATKAPTGAPEQRVIGLPIHTGLVTVGFIVGVGFTTTVVDPVQVAAPVAVTVYTPAIDALQFGIVTFCPVAVNPLGPVQVYPVAPVAAVAFRVIVVPEQ
jgi:hypothetical protein